MGYELFHHKYHGPLLVMTDRRDGWGPRHWSRVHAQMLQSLVRPDCSLRLRIWTN